MIERFKSFIAEHSLFAGSDSILLAVSAGVDSMVMLDLFVRSGYKIGIAHGNFKLRGEASDADEVLVEKLANQLNIPFYSRRFNTAEYAGSKGISIQMAARDLRYAFFDEICEQHKFDYIATAHHLDDQIETFFINLLRGTGIAGLHGIPLRNRKIIRPMMFAYRSDLEGYLEEKKLEHREDESNLEVKYMRNKIRHELIPLFLEMNPAFRSEMTDTMKRLEGTEKIYKQVIELAIREVVTEEKGQYFLDMKKLSLFSPLEHILFEILSMFGFNQTDVSNIIPAMDGIPGKIFYSQAYRLIIDREKMIITGLKQEELSFDILIEENTREIRKPLPLLFEKKHAKGFIIQNDPHLAALDIDMLQFPLTLRKWVKGDTFIPLGMQNRKKLSDFFIDEKISIVEKENIWVLCSGDEIAWIIGHRIADPFKITSKTKKVFLITLH